MEVIDSPWGIRQQKISVSMVPKFESTTKSLSCKNLLICGLFPILSDKYPVKGQPIAVIICGIAY